MSGGTWKTRRAAIFAALCAGCVALAAGYAWVATAPSRQARHVRLPAVETIDDEGGPQTRVIVRHTGLDESYGMIAVDGTRGADRRSAPLHCERVHFSGDHGICLEADRGFLTTYAAEFFDRRFKVTHHVPLTGPPSRARMSPDGRYAAATVFVTGHSYMDTGFSTTTTIWDAVSGKPVIENLETLDVSRDGARFANSDFNFWGVTFAGDSNRFYASLGTGGAVYLIEGSMEKRAQVIREGVECPSLSPDGTRVAFKKRRLAAGALSWRLHVLDLKTLAETAVAESRSVDDQVEWLDDSRILYALADEAGPSAAVTNVWVANADGTGQPSIFLREAYSPAVVRGN